MNGDPSDRSLVGVAIGHQFLQLQSSSADETEGRAHGAGAVHVPLPQRPQGVGVVEGDAALLKVEAHAQPRRQRVGEAQGRRGPVAGGVADAVAVVAVVTMVVVVVVVAVLRQVDLPHPHGEEAEGWSRVQGILRPTVVTAVWVVAAWRDELMGNCCYIFITPLLLFVNCTVVEKMYLINTVLSKVMPSS